MVESLSAHEIEDQIGLRKVRFQQVIADIRTVLKADLEAFTVRETKKAFLAKSEVAETMPADRVSALRKRAAELGKSLAQRVDQAIADPTVWQAPPGEPSNARDLTGIPTMWSHVQSAEKDLLAFLHEFGIAPAEAPQYKVPAYFVAGLYMPSLAEHYWRIVIETRELEEQRKKLNETSVRERLQAKWDGAADA
jgi:hypothetical protein